MDTLDGFSAIFKRQNVCDFHSDLCQPKLFGEEIQPKSNNLLPEEQFVFLLEIIPTDQGGKNIFKLPSPASVSSAPKYNNHLH